MALILLVDSSEEWVDKISAALTDLKQSTIPVNNIGAGQTMLATMRMDLVICEKTVNATEDGLRWLTEIYFEENQTVLMLSESSAPEALPHLSKYDFSTEALSAALARLDIKAD